MPVKLYEWDKNETGWIWIEVTPNKVINLILRSLNNLIHVNDNNEVYVDLQLEDWLENTDDLPIWVNVGRVLAADGRPVTWTLISWQTTSWDWVKILYWDDWKIRVDNGTGEWKILAYEYWIWPGIEIRDDYSAMQWPCPFGYHIPTKAERENVLSIWSALWGGTSDGINFGIALKLPLAWIRSWTTWDQIYNWQNWEYWSCTALAEPDHWNYLAGILDFSSSSIGTRRTERTTWASIRPFKHVAVWPNTLWTKLYWVSIDEGWIFWSASDWLISLSSDWINWITISDKNLWATVVWDNNDASSQANCWTYFQRWNNYGFAWTWAITTSSTTVDASGYWPWNYYSSNTFITGIVDWSSVQNDNLRWWTIGVVPNAIINTWVLSVNGETWHVVTREPDIVSITISEDNWDLRWNITSWTLKDWSPVICEFDNLTTITSITEFLLSNDTIDLIPWISSIANGDVFTWLYRENIGTDWGVFLRQKRTPTP